MQSQKIRHYNDYSDINTAQGKSPPVIDEQKTKKEVGVWIDHRKAVIVTFTDTGTEIKQITSHLESDARPAAGWPAHSGQDYKANTEDHQDRRAIGHLDRYYDEVIAAVHDAESILILGPGEAKGELKKRIESKGPKGHSVEVEATDVMTEPQIAAKVRQHFVK